MGMARGLEYLHSIGIVHGDVRCVSYLTQFANTKLTWSKQSNVLISDDNEALISDFGLSTYLPKMSASNNLHGSFRWRAPEMHRPEKFNLTIQQAHSLPVDVWSFGMTILVCPRLIFYSSPA
jgi:serine/threonine protein kinase